DERRLEELAAEHPGIVSAPADVSDDADRAALVKQCERVDVLVNNAGLGWQGVVESMPPDKVRQLFEVNVLALIDLTQRVLPGMLERRRGTSSTSAPSPATWPRRARPSTARRSSRCRGSPTGFAVKSAGAACRSR